MGASASATATRLAAAAIAASAWAGAAAAKPSVVSLNLCSDEILLLVAEPAQIRSVSYLSHLRDETSLWRPARRHPANDGSMLAAAVRRPGLIVTMGAGEGAAGRDRARLARAVGARLLVLPYPASLADIAASVRSVGRATGNVARAERVVASMRAAVATAPRRPRDAIWIDGAGRTKAADGLGAAWLRLAGLRQRSVAGDRVGLEALMTRPPDVLVRSLYRAGQMSSATAQLRHPAAARVRVGRTLFTDGRRWTCAGPALVPEILRLRAAVAR